MESVLAIMTTMAPPNMTRHLLARLRRELISTYDTGGYPSVGLDKSQCLDLVKTPADCFTHLLQIGAIGSIEPSQNGSSLSSRHIRHFASDCASILASIRSVNALVKHEPQTILPWCHSTHGEPFAQAASPHKSQRISSGCTFSSSIPSRCIS